MKQIVRVMIVAPALCWAGLACAQDAAGGVERTIVKTEDGVKLAVTQRGNGELVVIVPDAIELAAELAPLAQNHQMVFYDPRNRGHSDAVDDVNRVGIDIDVKDLEAVRKAVGAGKVALIGWGYYAKVATRYEDRYPDRVSRVVLLSPQGSRPEFDKAAWERNRSRIDPEAAKQFRALTASGEAKRDPQGYCHVWSRTVRSGYMAKRDSYDQILSEVCSTPNEYPDRIETTFARIDQKLAGYDWRAEIGRVGAHLIPTLVLYGAEDGTPKASMEDWAAQPAARTLELPGTGHWPFVEQRGPTLNAIDLFLKGGWPDGAQ